MSIVNCFLYQEQYMCSFFLLVLYAQGVFFIISLRIVSHARREQVFVFSFFPAINLPFSLSFMLFFYRTLLDMCYCLQNFWQHFLHDVLKPLQLKTLVQVITFHMNTYYK